MMRRALMWLNLYGHEANVLEWMGLKFYDYDGLQKKSVPSNISAGSVAYFEPSTFYLKL